MFYVKSLITTMDIRLFLIYVVMFRAMQQGPAAYQDLVCMEPDPGYTKIIFHHFEYFTAMEMGKECPTSADLAWRIGNEVFCTLLCVLLTLMLGYVPSIAKNAKARQSAINREWRNSPSLCCHCGTSPCQVKRITSQISLGCQKRDKANFAKRSNAMMVFSYGLALSVDQTKELPQDKLYQERKSCQYFKEKHMVLFPLCIQRRINYWYPVPRIARWIGPTVESTNGSG